MPVLGSVLITPVLPQLSEHFGDVPASEVLVPMIVALPALMIAVFAPFAGQIVDRFGRKPLLFWALIAYAVVGTVPAWVDDLSVILATRVLVGICEAAIMTACTTLLVDYFPGERRRNRYLALQTVVTTLAATAFILLGGALGWAGWQTPFWVYAVSLIIASVMSTLLWEPTDADADARMIDAHSTTPGRFRVRGRIPWERIGVPLLVSVFGGFTFYVMVLEVGYLVVGTGVAVDDTHVIGWVAAVCSLATVLGGLSFPRVSRLPRGVVLPAAFVIQAVGMLVVWLVPSGGVIVGAVLASFGSGLLLPGLITWVVAAANFGDRGRITGLWTAAFFFGQFLTPVGMAALTTGVGSLTAAVGLVGIGAVVIAFAVAAALLPSASEPA